MKAYVTILSISNKDIISVEHPQPTYLSVADVRTYSKV